MIIIKPLTAETLEAAIALAEKSFSLDFNANPNRIRTGLAATVYPDKYPERFSNRIAPECIKYWVALENNQVVGVVGYYILTEDQADAAWISWYCVDFPHRGKKIGLQLLEFIIEKVKSLGKTYLRLLSSDTPTEYRAHEIYKKRGFTSFRESEVRPRSW